MNRTVLADRHEWPSFVFVNGYLQQIGSRSPGGTLTLRHSTGALRVLHGGDIMPGQRAMFNYINTANGALVAEYATEQANDEGVIDEWDEALWLGHVPAGTQLAVYGYWMDECGAGFQSAILLGYITMEP